MSEQMFSEIKIAVLDTEQETQKLGDRRSLHSSLFSVFWLV